MTKRAIWTDRGEVWSFPEFVKQPKEFYHWLIEGRKEEVDIFLKYMRKYENVDKNKA